MIMLEAKIEQNVRGAFIWGPDDRRSIHKCKEMLPILKTFTGYIPYETNYG
jgi:hypothetical protein